MGIVDISEAVVEKKEDERTDQDAPALYFLNLRLAIAGCNEMVAIQVSEISFTMHIENFVNIHIVM